MDRKRLLPALAALIVLAGAMAALWYIGRPTGNDGQKAFTVEVCHSDGSKVIFSCESDRAFLGEFLQEEGLISGEAGPYGLFVDTVDGESAVYAENAAWWQLLCNGESASAGADSIPLEDGAVYCWVYTVG